MAQRARGPWRKRAIALGAVALMATSTVATSTALSASAAGAAPRRAADAGRRSTAPHPAALPALPINSAYARQILLALYPGDGEPTRADVIAVGKQLDGGASGVVAVYPQLVSSRWRTERVTADFNRYLGRAPDPSGLAYWLAKHASLEDQALSLATSSEAWRKAGSTPEGFVDYAYASVLGRPADPAGRASWLARIADGRATSSSIIRTMLRSNERVTKLVRAAYEQYLQRAADPAGAAPKIADLRAGRNTEIGLITGLLGSMEARRSGCDPLDPRMCMLPFPNDLYTVPDPTTATGRRVSIKREWLPANKDGVRANPQELNRNDGFSVGQAALLKVPGIDLTQTGAAPLNDVGASLDADAPIVVIDADTGERHPIFTELDANIPAAQQAADQLLFIRPAVNYAAGHRYIVALRNLKTSAGAVIPAPSSFTFYRDGDTGVGVGAAEARRPHMDQIFTELANAGIAKDDLYLAWDFTVASVENTTGRMLHIRDDALASLGGHAPAFTVTKVTNAPDTGIAKQVDGTFQVPLYLTGDGSPGHAFNNGADGLPKRNGTYTASFQCELPDLASGASARGVVYGHGLFGDRGEVGSGSQKDMVRNHDMAYCATDWIGMSESDVGNAATILKDVSTFPTLADRSQQGILDTIFLGRLMTTDDGFVADPAFQHDGGQPVLDTSDLFYDGNSQGAIIGGAYVAVSPDVSAGVLGVAGMNYSNLLERSVDFDPFFQIMKPNYPNAVDRVLGLQVIQMLWDRAETDGYAAHLTTNPLPGTGPHRVLIHTAVGDHQVATYTAEIEARTAGMSIHRPVYGTGRTFDVDPGWGLPSINYPSNGSALVVWDSGSPLAPLANVPPRAGHDPHEDPRHSPEAQAQKDQFLRTDGTLIDVCSAAPCEAPQD